MKLSGAIGPERTSQILASQVTAELRASGLCDAINACGSFPIGRKVAFVAELDSIAQAREKTLADLCERWELELARAKGGAS